MPKIKPRSSRRVPPLKDSDYDHEISLDDHNPATESPGRALSPVSTAGPSIDRPSTTEPLVPAASSPSRSPNQQNGDVEVDDENDTDDDERPSPSSGAPVVEVEQPTPADHPSQTNGSPRRKPPREEPESAIDILYENERGGILCGLPLFSSKALGNLDPPAWTNFAHRPSPTNTSNAQVPDPSWQWAWPEWRVNQDDGTDEGGWQYSFMFAKKFSWHRARWYNSFVRRRAWIRKRIKKGPLPDRADPHLLNLEYFTVQTAAEMRQGSSRASSRLGSKASMTHGDTDAEDEREKPVIEDIEMLMRVLRAARIDREKVEAVENYLANGTDDLVHLQDEMHDIMSLFVFQASRKLLLSRLTQLYDKTVAEEKAQDGGEGQNSRGQSTKAQHLSAAIKHADEEVRKLEFWSDIKAMAESGESAGAVDHERGWDESWTGLDRSAPGPPAPPPKGEDEKK